MCCVRKAYGQENQLGVPIRGEGVGTVIKVCCCDQLTELCVVSLTCDMQTRSSKFKEGDVVLGPIAWRNYAIVKETELDFIPKGIKVS